MKLIIFLVVVISVLIGCQNLSKEVILGVYSNDSMDSKIIINDSLYLYKVNGKIVNHNKYRLSDSSNEVIFMKWIDKRNTDICSSFGEGIICIVPIDNYGLRFFEDERYKNFKKQKSHP